MSVGDGGREERVFVLLVPFRTDYEVRPHLRGGFKVLAQRLGAGGVERVAAQIGILVTGTYQHAEPLAAELRFVKDPAHERRPNLVTHLATKTPGADGFASVPDEAVKVAQHLAQASLRLLQDVRRDRFVRTVELRQDGRVG